MDIKDLHSKARHDRYERNKESDLARQREYDKSHPRNPEKGRKYRLKNKHKITAKNAVNYAVSKGLLIKPDICEGCGEQVRLDGHHEDYSKPLSVVWVCRSCHLFVHALEGL